ncbi:MAG: hypothetical protein C4305_01105 [Thermoleophilia bacterium]
MHGLGRVRGEPNGHIVLDRYEDGGLGGGIGEVASAIGLRRRWRSRAPGARPKGRSLPGIEKKMLSTYRPPVRWRDGSLGRRGKRTTRATVPPHDFGSWVWIGFRAGASRATSHRSRDVWENGTVLAAVFEARMTREQARRLAGLMQEGRASGRAGILASSFLYQDGVSRVIDYWRDRDTLDRYLATAEAPRGSELMRQVGAEPKLRIVEVLELG